MSVYSLTVAVQNITKHLKNTSPNDEVKTMISLELGTLQTACYSGGAQPTPFHMFQDLKNCLALSQTDTLKTMVAATFGNNDVCFLDDAQLGVMGEILFFKFKPRAIIDADKVHCTGETVWNREETKEVVALGAAQAAVVAARAKHESNKAKKARQDQKSQYYMAETFVSEDDLNAANAKLVQAQADVDDMDAAAAAFKRARRV